MVSLNQSDFLFKSLIHIHYIIYITFMSLCLLLIAKFEKVSFTCPSRKRVEHLFPNHICSGVRNLNNQRAFVVVRHYQDIPRILCTGIRIPHITGIKELSGSSSGLNVTCLFILNRGICSFFQSALKFIYNYQMQVLD